MNYNKKTVADVNVSGKKVLLRCDFNVPQDKETGAITSDKRIVAALPTIRYLLDHGAAVIACSHLGKPEPDFDKWVKKQSEKGKDPASLTREKWEKSLQKLTLAPVAERLSQLLGQEVLFAHDVVGEDATAKAAALQPGQVLLLENTRFEKGETKNDPAFAEKLASLAEIYVSDAFGAVHRAHASTAGVAKYLPAVSGFLIEKELRIIGGALASPKRPLVAILGGSKVSSKIGVINNLLEIADTVIIGLHLLRRPGRKDRRLPPGTRLDGVRPGHDKKGCGQGREAAAARGHRYRRPLCPRCRHPGGPRRRDSRRVAGPGHRPGDREALYPGCVGRGYRHLERPHGRI